VDAVRERRPRTVATKAVRKGKLTATQEPVKVSPRSAFPHTAITQVSISSPFHLHLPFLTLCDAISIQIRPCSRLNESPVAPPRGSYRDIFTRSHLPTSCLDAHCSTTGYPTESIHFWDLLRQIAYKILINSLHALCAFQRTDPIAAKTPEKSSKFRKT
jgi:hypothetical protein